LPSLPSLCLCGESFFFKQREAGGEAVDEVAAADRAEFALGEEAGQGHVAGLGTDRGGVVVRLREEARAPAVAAEQERRGRRAVVPRPVLVQQGAQVLVGSLGVADV